MPDVDHIYNSHNNVVNLLSPLALKKILVMTVKTLLSPVTGSMLAINL